MVSTEVRASLRFIVPQEMKPYFESSASTGTVPKVHFQTCRETVTVHDMRPMRDELHLDEHGFELIEHTTAVDDLYDDRALATAYKAELEALLLERLGADRVAVFDFTRRSDSPDGAMNPDGQRGPADRVHVDYTVKSGPKRAADALGRDVYDAVINGGGRIVQINVWRPIRGPVERSPLALADAGSIAPAHLVATDQRFPDRVGEIYHLSHDPTQRWYWAPRMRRDEVLLIKGWDSVSDGRARFTPHGAFVLPEQTHEMAPRESLEVRTYVLFDRWPTQ